MSDPKDYSKMFTTVIPKSTNPWWAVGGWMLVIAGLILLGCF